VPWKFLPSRDSAQQNPRPISSPSSSVNLALPVVMAMPPTSTITASKRPAFVVRNALPVKRAPVTLSNFRSWPSAIRPRACCSAMRAVTPLPVGLRSTSRSAKTQIFAVGSGPKASLPSVKDCTVEECQIGIVGMVELDLGLRRLGHLVGGVDQIAGGRTPDVEAETRCRNESIEGAAVADIGRKRAIARNIDGGIQREGEGRHTGKFDRSVFRYLRFHQAAGALDGNLAFAGGPGHAAAVDRPAAERYHRVAAHGGIALVVDEQHGQIGARQIGFHQQHAIHVIMTARLEHQEAAQMVQMFTGMAALGQQRGTGNRRIPRYDEAHRLAAGVHLDGSDFEAHVRLQAPNAILPRRAARGKEKFRQRKSGAAKPPR